MKKTIKKSFACILMVAGLISGSQTISAQTVIGNTPSTDVVERGKFYGEALFGAHFDKFEKGGFRAYNFRAIYGLTRDLEIGANVSYTRNGGDPEPVEVSPNFKWKAYKSEKHRIAVSTGAMLFVPLRAGAGSRPEAIIYANVSKAVDLAKGMRFTTGAYTRVGARSGSGDKSGVTLAWEKALHKRVNFYADWYSGKNRFGYTGAGFTFAVTPKQTIAAGYNFGNAGRGNNSLTVSYGFFR